MAVGNNPFDIKIDTGTRKSLAGLQQKRIAPKPFSKLEKQTLSTNSKSSTLTNFNIWY